MEDTACMSVIVFMTRREKRNRKITGKYLGSITEEGGFRPSKKRQLEQEMEQLKNGEKATVAGTQDRTSQGIWVVVADFNKMGTITERLKKDFPNDYNRIISLAYCRLRYQSPMRDVQSDFCDSYLSTELGTVGLAASQLSGFLFDLGNRREEIVKYMDYFCSGSSNIIFDGTDMLSASRLMGLPQLTKTKTGAFEKAVNLMMVFSLDYMLPSYFRLLPGNIKGCQGI